jgi:archaetidylserine synthase
MNVFYAMRLPDLLSLLNAFLGLFSILAAFAGRYDISVPFIILAAVADGLDGFLARRFGAGPLGLNLDSFADLVSFGAAPAILAITILQLPWQAWTIGGIYFACGTLRLARFNVSPKNDRFFEGLPIPPCGIAVAASALLGWQNFTLILMLILSALMVSSIHYPKVRDLRAAGPLAVIFLATAVLFSLNGDSNLTVISSYSIITTIMIYAASPVVMSFLQKER